MSVALQKFCNPNIRFGIPVQPISDCSTLEGKNYKVPADYSK
jgi:hypothetical protein